MRQTGRLVFDAVQRYTDGLHVDGPIRSPSPA
jgi:hypothetical protein